jgi:mycothione reductase
MSSTPVADVSAHPSPASASHHFDLIVIGTGSGNSLISDDMNGWNIAIVEEGVFGGTCLNRGCIPTKMFVHTADMAESIRHAHHFGVDASVDAVRWKDIRDRVFGRIDPIADGGRDYRTNRCENVTVFAGRGNFIGERMINVAPSDGSANVTITGDRVVVAVGARPHLPFIPGLTEVSFHTSDSIMRVDELPQRLVIVGGGFIASEFCHVFASFGVHVTMVVRGEALLRDHDHDIAHAFTAQVASRPNVDVRLSTTPRSVAKTATGFTMTLSDGTTIDGDALLLATGRIPNSDTVSAAQGGMKIHPDGRIVVDMFQKTTAAGVWALGDVSSPHQLKHVANHEARVVRQHLLDPTSTLSTDHRFVPAAVFTKPQIATVGLTERAARDAGIDIMVKTQMYGDVAYGWAMEDTTSMCKLIADRTTRKLVGVHIMGPSASSIVQQLIQGITFGQTIDEMAHGQYYIHPALPEVIENALLGLA